MPNVNRFLKMANPFAKPKYVSAIDSELVMWMKDEKACKNNAVEIDTEILNLQAVRAIYVIAYLLHKGPTS